MKILFVFIIYIVILLTKEDYVNEIDYNDEKQEIKQSLIDIQYNLNIILQEVAKNTNNTSDSYKKCVYNIMNMDKTKNDIPINKTLRKIYEGSSKGFIDLSGFYNCINIKDNKNDFNYYTIYPKIGEDKKGQINTFNNKTIEEDLWIFGICLKDGLCDEKALKEMFEKVKDLFGMFSEYNKENINIIDNLGEYKKMISLKSLLVHLIPVYFIIIQLIFIIFKIIPIKIFGYCIKKKYISEIENNPKKLGSLFNKSSFNNKINLKIRECFSFTENLDELINPKKENDLYNLEDITYIKGIQTLGIIFFIFGTTFIYFFNYPICISLLDEKIDYMKAKTTSILIILWRISPALLLSCSGYSLCYKFLNFLDKKLANISSENIETMKRIGKGSEMQEENISKEETNNDNLSDPISKSKSSSSNNKESNYYSESNLNSEDDISKEIGLKSFVEDSYGIKYYQKDISKKALNNLFDNQNVNEAMALSKISTAATPYSFYFSFLFRQIHKLVNLNICIPLFKKSFPIFLASNSPGAPLLNYLMKEIIEKVDYGFGNFFMFLNFYELFSESHDDKDKHEICVLEIFSIIVSEFNFFIIGTLLIFICYKRKYSLDYILCFLILIFIVFKIILLFIKKANPGTFYFDSDYQKLFFNPIFNFDYFLIGMFFGIVNYAVQNEISKKESLMNERPMVTIPIFISRLCDYQKRENFIIMIISTVFMLFFLIIFPILFIHKFEEIIEKNDPPIYFTILSSIDVDLFIGLFHLFMMSCYISGRNMVFKFFNSGIWTQGAKLYFWLVMLTPLVNYYIIYKTETQLNLSFTIVLFYGAICSVNLYLISFFFFIILEVPYKKLTKLYFNISSKINSNEEDDDEENDSKYPLQKNSLITELSEKDLEAEGKDDNDNEEED
jgi:hypothetical protein